MPDTPATTCAHCGAAIERRTSWQRYCSRSCRQSAWLVRHVARLVARALQTKREGEKAMSHEPLYEICQPIGERPGGEEWSRSDDWEAVPTATHEFYTLAVAEESIRELQEDDWGVLALRRVGAQYVEFIYPIENDNDGMSPEDDQ